MLSYGQIASALSGGLSFDSPSGTVLTPGASTKLSNLIAPDGKPVDLLTGSQGVVADPPPTGTSPLQMQFNGPPGTYTETLSSSTAVSEQVQSYDFHASIAAGPGSDAVTIDTNVRTVAVGAPRGGATSARATVEIGRDTGNGGLLTATVTGVPAAGATTEALSPAGELTVTSAASASEQVAVELTNQNAGEVVQRFSGSLTVGAGQTAMIAPDWSSFTGGSLTAQISTHRASGHE